MARIEGIYIRNFKSLKKIMLGKHWSSNLEPLTPMTVVIGKNGVGKSTLFDVFGFLADAFKFGVEDACDLKGRGGFDKIRSQGEVGPIIFDITYRVDSDASIIFNYSLAINNDIYGRPVVCVESLLQYFDDKKDHPPSYFLLLENGIGHAWKDEGKRQRQGGFDKKRLVDAIEHVKATGGALSQEYSEVEKVELSDIRKLGLATLGSLKQHLQISAFRQFIESWYLSYFTPDAARTLPLSGIQQHLNSKGDNLANVVQFMEREHRDKFQSILNRIAEKIPGIDKIDTEKTSDGRLLLRFNDKGFTDPFYAPQMSDGTLKVFAYLLLLEDPDPPPFICIEEPENGLYHKLLETLAAEFRSHATGRKGGSQLFITTHQPYFVDALEPEEVWILEKGADGFASIRRASDDGLVKSMVADGLPLGGLWYSDYLDAG